MKGNLTKKRLLSRVCQLILTGCTISLADGDMHRNNYVDEALSCLWFRASLGKYEFQKQGNNKDFKVVSIVFLYNFF